MQYGQTLVILLLAFITGWTAKTIFIHFFSKVTLQEIKDKELYVSGRIATKADVDKKKAIFQIEGENVSPIKIEIPQYALHTDSETKEKTLWIIVQAEENHEIKAIGAINPKNGGSLVGLEHEFELLGNSLPKK